MGLTWEKHTTAFFQDVQVLMSLAGCGVIWISDLNFVVDVSEADLDCVLGGFYRLLCDSVKIVMIF